MGGEDLYRKVTELERRMSDDEKTKDVMFLFDTVFRLIEDLDDMNQTRNEAIRAIEDEVYNCARFIQEGVTEIKNKLNGISETTKIEEVVEIIDEIRDGVGTIANEASTLEYIDFYEVGYASYN